MSSGSTPRGSGSVHSPPNQTPVGSAGTTYDVACGLVDFLTAPRRLWLVHCDLKRLNLDASGQAHDRKHRMERLTRLELRRNLMQTGSSSKSSKIEEAAADVGSSVGQANDDVQQSSGLLGPLVRIWAINVGIIMLFALLSSVPSFWPHSLRPSFLSSSLVNSLAKLTSLLVHICLPLVMELVNTLYLKKICDRIAQLTSSKRSSSSGRHVPSPHVRHSESPSSSQSFGNQITDRLYSLLFFVIYQLQWNLVSTLLTIMCSPAAALVNVFSVAFLYACYSIEYRWRQNSNATFEGFLRHSIDHWTYFFGYGLCLGLLSTWLPHFIGWGGVVLALNYPLLVVGALSSGRKPQPSASTSVSIPMRLCQIVLSLSMRPALYVTNLIVRLTALLACRICFGGRR